MKNIFVLAVLISTVLFSCKKEDPETTINTPTPAVAHENYMVINGDNHTNDTIRFTGFLQGNVHGDTIDISTQQSNQTYAFLYQIPLHTGSTDSLFSTAGNVTSICISNLTYMTDGAIVTISHVGNVGGLVDGYYSGRFRRGNPPYVYINVSGKFSVIRN